MYLFYLVKLKDEVIRDMIGKTNYLATIWFNNRSVVDCAQMNGGHKMKYFHDSLENIQRNLETSDWTESKVHSSVTYGDYIKLCSIEGRFTACWICMSVVDRIRLGFF